MTHNLKIREINDSEMDNVSHLHKKYYGDIRPPKVWYWEFKDLNPEKSVLIILQDDKDIVGTQGMIPIYLNIGGKKWLTGKSESTLIDSRYRGKDLFSKFYEFAVDQCERKGMVCIWGFTKVLKAFKKVKFRIYNDSMKCAILPLKFQTTKKSAIPLLKSKSKVKSIIFSTGILFGCFFTPIRLKFNRVKKKAFESNYELSKTLKSMSDVTVLYDSLRKTYPDLIHIHQNETYINWRIYNNPMNKKVTFFVYVGDLLIGYLYITIRDKAAELTDFTFINKNAGIYLMKILLDFIKTNRIGFVTYSGNIKNSLNQQVFNLLRSYGFIMIGRSNEFILRNINFPEEERLSNINNWYINDLWSEGA